MNYLSVNTPLGSPVTLFEEDGALVALDWGRAPGGTSSPVLDQAKTQIEAFFDGGRRDFDLPLAPAGTAFQKRVWDYLRTIPRGTVQTYGDVARAVNSAARAVGGACAANPLPIIIPCHRVLGTNGRMTGYSGLEGVETKVLLLRLEGFLID